MFEKVKYLSEKINYKLPPDELSGHINPSLESYTRKMADIKSAISVFEKEIELIEKDLNDFLELYYSRMSDVISEIKPESVDKNAENNFKFNKDKSGFYDKRFEARKVQAKSLYKKLIKKVHPDSSDRLENGSQDSLDIVQRINHLYKTGDLEEMIYMDLSIKLEEDEGENPIKKIEILEKKEKYYVNKLYNLEEKLDNIKISSEYSLFLKYRLAEIRGEDFFGTIIGSFSKNSST